MKFLVSFNVYCLFVFVVAGYFYGLHMHKMKLKTVPNRKLIRINTKFHSICLFIGDLVVI